ncbi:DUF2690 domain-containing protein [Actinoplanes sp. NPDC049596]|uniref:DUF2690 domain-containing protein n=1 Tax=unclassified Actinoplanes TaxID=2626549 RepID=UPI0034264D0B
MRRSMTLIALLALVATVAPPAAAASAPDGKTFVAATTIRSDDGKVLPARTYRLADGATETVVDPAAFQAVLAAAAASSDPCGYVCDGKDPASYPVLGRDGHSYLCQNDAFSPRTYNGGYATVELRYSPRCRTAWTRGCCYTVFSGFSYYLSGSQRNWVYADARNSGNRVYTVMLNDADLQYKACYDNQAGGSPEWKCTGKY